ncbi:hypothetical protein D8682_11405 [Buttiauxella sp. 3AFRM03]|nr:hypothetical protein D8682_11405 [Buttiauxella sp. 3AFRM03]
MCFLPFIFRVVSLLAALPHPSHIVRLCSWGFARLPPRYTPNYLDNTKHNKTGSAFSCRALKIGAYILPFNIQVAGRRQRSESR